MEVMSFPLPGYEGLHVGFPTIARLLSHWNKDRPDIVYVATEALLGFAAVHSARMLGIPVATGYHTNFQQYLSYYHMPRLEPIADGLPALSSQPLCPDLCALRGCP